MAKLDIAEKRIPQYGRISLRIAGRAVDVRVSTMPSSFGERVVLRLLDKNNARLNLEDLGMTLRNRELFSHLIKASQLSYTGNISVQCEAIVKVHGVFPSSRGYTASSRRFQFH